MTKYLDYSKVNGEVSEKSDLRIYDGVEPMFLYCIHVYSVTQMPQSSGV